MPSELSVYHYQVARMAREDPEYQRVEKETFEREKQLEEELAELHKRKMEAYRAAMDRAFEKVTRQYFKEKEELRKRKGVN